MDFDHTVQEGDKLKKMEGTGLAEKNENFEGKIGSFSPSYTAQTGGLVLAPSITSSHIGVMNINITSREVNPDPGKPNNPDDAAAQQHRIEQKLKAAFVKRFSNLNESLSSIKTPLNKIYTELFITEGRSCAVNSEHEIRQIEATSRRAHLAPEKSVCCNDLFAGCQARTVVTRGVAGIGKTILVQKFTLDWAKDGANSHLKFIFHLCFRELNLIKKECSLEELISDLFPETTDSGISRNIDKYKVLFILDGLDESRLKLNFQSGEIVTDVSKVTTVALILVNLIRRKMLPEANLWITTRPAAFSLLPLESMDLVTEVRGFNDEQKEEYFHRKIEDQKLAQKVVAHVKSCRSLHIMCHIPIFCWMAASVLQNKSTLEGGKDAPKTLTQMYIHFLSIYVEGMKKRLSLRRASNSEDMKENLISLGKLAFGGLKEGQLIFYEDDLRRSGIHGSRASILSGLYTEIFNEEMVPLGGKTFCFVHLSIQEFFAALYVFLMFHNENNNVLVKKSSASRRLLSRDSSEEILYKAAVEKALQHEDGRFDLFLRFLLGFSLEENQALLKHLMSSKRSKSKTRSQVIKHIKEKIQSSPSLDRSLNLFYCLNEMNDQSLVEEIQTFMKAGSVSSTSLSSSQWAGLVFVLLTSAEELSVFELKKYSRSEEGLVSLLPVLRTAKVAKLDGCHLTAKCCEPLANIMDASRLQELDLSHNTLTDEGLTQLSRAMKSIKLQTLRLESCSLTGISTEHVAELLSADSGRLEVLDLRDNDFGDEGVRRVSVGLASPHCKLKVLNLSLCRVTEVGCTYLGSALNSSLQELDMSYNHPGDSGVKLLSTLCADPARSLEKLSLDERGEWRILPGPQRYATLLSLDPDTAQYDISLAEGNRRASRGNAQPHPSRPERFDFYRQVLCREGLAGRFYWETKWCGRVLIAVAYKRMSRKGEGPGSWLGRNDCSWGLFCREGSFRTFNNGITRDLSIKPETDRVGVFLDWHAGTLSFYMLDTDSMTRLAKFRTTFTEPVHPGFWLAWVNSTVQLC